MMRLDVYLTVNGYASSRQRAQAMLKNNEVTVDGARNCKPSFDIDEAAAHCITTDGNVNRYVSRGGLKLEGALERFAIDVRGQTIADIGASTGGFTDCLLQHGAACVYAVDVGETQLRDSLKKDGRVIVADHCNARFLTADSFPVTFDAATMDVSFISQTLIIPALYNVLRDGGVLISLIKPQFEVGPEKLNKHGVVTDTAARINAVKKVLYTACSCGFYPTGLMKSLITGGDGNIEYLFTAGRGIVSQNAEKDTVTGLLKSLEE